MKSRWWSKILDGEATILIHNGKILERNLVRTRFTLSDLMEQLRVKAVFNMSDVEFCSNRRSRRLGRDSSFSRGNVFD